MKNILNMNKEPAILIGIAVIIVIAGVNVADVTDSVQGIIELLVIAAGAKLTRESVWSPDGHKQALNEAINAAVDE